VQEERYVLRNMERQEPQGEENHHNYHHHPGRVGKNPGSKKTSPVVFFGFFVFFSILEERVFRFFSVSRILLGASRR
jgi:hypothetical protein